jgi:hypothetical protein
MKEIKLNNIKFFYIKYIVVTLFKKNEFLFLLNIRKNLLYIILWL